MYWKDAYIHTLRENPAEAELTSHRLMTRAGMIQKAASGIYNYLPLGLRVIRKIERIIRSEMEKCGSAELLMPVVVPAELWKESGRWDFYGPELLRLKDRKKNDFCLGPTHEEVIVSIAKHAVRSYRDLPINLYQIQTKFRDEIRPRYGLMRGREFIMKDAYSFHETAECLDKTYWRMHQGYTNIFSQFGLNFRPVEADSGAIGGDVTHEFHVLADSGEDTIVYCKSCDYAANMEKAETGNPVGTLVEATADTPEKGLVETPNTKSIADVSKLLGVKPTETIKMLVYMVNNGEYRVAVCIRGDLELNEIKLKNILAAENVDVPDEARLIEETSLPVGFLGAFDIDRSIIKEVIADNSLKGMDHCVVGANKVDYHYKNINILRDLTIDRYADLRFASKGSSCPRCEGGKLDLCKGIEVGQVFKLGDKYSKAMSMTFLEEAGEKVTPLMGCYGIGVGRTAAAAVEQNNDKDGIIWPIEIAPYEVSVLCLDPNDEEVFSTAVKIHDELVDLGYDVILDDRDERPGVKFKDNDLIGIPLRLVVGGRGLKNGIIEVKERTAKKSEDVSVDTIVAFAKERITQLYKRD